MRILSPAPFRASALACLAFSFIVPSPRTHAADFTQYVDPFIGTGGVGHTFPGATFPLGLTQVSPDTGNGNWNYCSGYQYNDVSVDGFSNTHLSGGGGADLGDVLMLPFSSDAVLQAEKATQNKQAEIARPGFYATQLSHDQIQVELSATQRTAIHRYTYQPGHQKQVLVSIDRVLWSYGSARGRTFDATLTVDDNRRLHGSYVSRGRVVRHVSFAIEFSQPFQSHRFLDEAGKKLVLDFGDGDLSVVTARIGISTVSPESARRNLEVESLGKSFEEITTAANEAWNRYLSKIRIEGTPQEKVTFYTSLYRLFIQPNNIADVDGYYRGADDAIHRSRNGTHYSTLPLWDSFRGAHPLYTIIAPAENVQFLESLLRHHEEKGYLPAWGFWGRDSRAMIGNHGVTVLWDAIQKGLPGIEPERAYRAIKDTLTQQHWRKYDWSKYDPYGYFPADVIEAESVSRTLEACLNDWCAAQLAERLGKAEDHAFFLRRSQFYRNLYDRETGFFRGKLANGSWREPFDPLQVEHAGTSNGDYTEANAWQYLWSVQHDIPGLIDLLGGRDALRHRLDTLFSLPEVIYGTGNTKDVSGMTGQYAHGNEPSHHVIYLYNQAGRPERAQELIRHMLATKYHNTPDGLSGNDDYGQMSAWYILSSLGFYPVHPASGWYDLGLPLHARARVSLGDSGRTLEIRAEPFSAEKRYVRRVTLNGKPLEKPLISYDQIMHGGELVFEMVDRSP